MTQTALSPEELFDRPWRSGHPFRPRVGRRRQVGMFCLFVIFVIVIGGYWIITDANRVRHMAEVYLSQIVGGKVEVQRAELSLFEGLRLDGVKVSVREARRNDSLLFTAQTLLMKCSLQDLVNGKLDASQLVALNPNVWLCEDTARIDRPWNFQRLVPVATAPSSASAGPPTRAIPEVLLRNAQVHYSRYVDGTEESLGSMAIEARISPGAELTQYRVDLASRGPGQMTGPSIRGTVDIDTLEVAAELHGFDFRGAVKSMLPGAVQMWLERHELTGRIDIPVFNIQPHKDGSRGWRIVTAVDAVNMAIPPEEWLAKAAGKNIEARRGFFRIMRRLGLNELAGVNLLKQGEGAEPIRLSQVTGKFIFTEDGIEVDNIAGWFEQNALSISGKIHGYPGYGSDPASPAFSMHVAAKQIVLPESPFYMASMPPEIREVYDRFRPTGNAKLTADIARVTSGGPVKTSGVVDVVDSSFCYDKFPYHLQHVTGIIRFGHDDPKTGGDWVRLEDIRCHGREPSPNANGTFVCNGYISPLDETNGVEILARGEDVVLDDELFNALGPETRKILKLFAPQGAEFPKVRAGFVCKVTRPVGYDKDAETDVEVSIQDGQATYAGFAVPLEHLKGVLHVREDHVEATGIVGRHGDATLTVDGRVETPPGGHVFPDLKITAREMPIDDDLLAAMPEHQRNWVDKSGLTGKFDLDGRIFPLKNITRKVATPPADDDSDYDFEMHLSLRDGTIWPVDGVPALTDLAGEVDLKHEQLVVRNFTGKRGQADVSGHLELLSFEDPRVTLGGSIKNLALDNLLHQMVSPEAREAWDNIRPEGNVDVDLTYASGGTRSTTAPADTYKAVVRPHGLAVNYKEVPYRLEGLTGSATVTPGKVVLSDIVGQHGKATVQLSGEGGSDTGGVWNMKIAGKRLVVDDDLRRALPATLASLVETSKLTGTLSFDCSRLILRNEATDAPSVNGAVTRPATTSAVDFAVNVGIADGTMDTTFPLTAINGTVDLAGTTLAGKLVELRGKVDLPTLQFAGRPTKNFRCDLFKPADREGMQLSKIAAQLGGGDLAGQIEAAWPDKGPGRYAVAAVLRNAQVQGLMGQQEKGVQGQITASLAMEGDWGDARSRKGRGDVLVTGKELYHVPLVLGLLQITDLALPIKNPYDQASTRYTVEGERVNFESIELRSGTMMMTGNGSLDYGTKKVHMTFVTDSPGWKIPLLHDLFQGAKQELLQIHVNGTVQEPKVSAGLMNTFTTTVDEVLKGDAKGKKKP